MRKCFYKGVCPFWFHGCVSHDLDVCELRKDENFSIDDEYKEDMKKGDKYSKNSDT